MTSCGIGAVGCGGGGGGVVGRVSMCCCVEPIHRARVGSRKGGGRRDTGSRSPKAERRMDLLIVTAG